MDRGEIIKEIVIILVEALIGAMIGFFLGTNFGGDVEQGIWLAILFSGLIEGWKVLDEFVGTFMGYGAYGCGFAIVLNMVKVLLSCCLGFCLSVGKVIYLIVRFIILTRKAQSTSSRVEKTSNAKQCEKCGATVSANALFCTECGTPSHKKAPQKNLVNVIGVMVVLVIVIGLVVGFRHNEKKAVAESLIPPQLQREKTKTEETITQENKEQEAETEPVADPAEQQKEMLRKMLGEQAVLDIQTLGTALFSNRPFSEVSSLFFKEGTESALRTGYDYQKIDIDSARESMSLTLENISAYFYQEPVMEDGTVLLILKGDWMAEKDGVDIVDAPAFYMPIRYKEEPQTGAWKLASMPTLPMYTDNAAQGDMLNLEDRVKEELNRTLSFSRAE